MTTETKMSSKTILDRRLQFSDYRCIVHSIDSGGNHIDIRLSLRVGLARSYMGNWKTPDENRKQLRHIETFDRVSMDRTEMEFFGLHS